jgi:hypothetical protein
MNCTKHRTVLEFRPNIGQGWEGPTVEFSREPDDDSEIVETFLLEVGCWVDMGSPGTITVTVEPGDLLNP